MCSKLCALNSLAFLVLLTVWCCIILCVMSVMKEPLCQCRPFVKKGLSTSTELLEHSKLSWVVLLKDILAPFFTILLPLVWKVIQEYALYLNFWVSHFDGRRAILEKHWSRCISDDFINVTCQFPLIPGEVVCPGVEPVLHHCRLILHPLGAGIALDSTESDEFIFLQSLVSAHLWRHLKSCITAWDSATSRTRAT